MVEMALELVEQEILHLYHLLKEILEELDNQLVKIQEEVVVEQELQEQQLLQEMVEDQEE